MFDEDVRSGLCLYKKKCAVSCVISSHCMPQTITWTHSSFNSLTMHALVSQLQIQVLCDLEVDYLKIATLIKALYLPQMHSEIRIPLWHTKREKLTN